MSASEFLNLTNATNLCSVFETDRYKVVALVSVGTAAISVLACIAVIAIMLILKKHLFFTQRLILYLCLAALVNSLAIMARLYRVADNLDPTPLKVLCMIVAFLDQTTAWSETIAYVCITFNLFMNAVCNKKTEGLEYLYIFLIFFFPIIFNWIPFIQGTYGEAGAWCWIRDTNQDDNCSQHKLGVILRYVLWYIPNYGILVLLVLAYFVLLVIVSRQKKKWVGKFDPESERLKTKMEKEVWPLLFFPIGYFVICLFPFINRLQDTISPNDPIYVLWVLHAIFSPLQGGYIALIYSLDRETLRRLKFSQIIATLCKERTVVEEYPVGSGFSDSLRKGAGNEHAGRSIDKRPEGSVNNGFGKSSPDQQ